MTLFRYTFFFVAREVFGSRNNTIGYLRGVAAFKNLSTSLDNAYISGCNTLSIKFNIRHYVVYSREFCQRKFQNQDRIIIDCRVLFQVIPAI